MIKSASRIGIKSITVTAVTLLLTLLLTLTIGSEPPRVERAKRENDRRLCQEFRNRKLPYPPDKVYIRAFKKEKELELWVGNGSGSYTLWKSYPFCQSSGTLGPKRRQGDLQIPEGFYYIDRFNAWSQFYLSLGINYPNRSDRIRGNLRDPGGDIFIHGNCVTIGCIPITDEKIKELYWLCHQARGNTRRRIPVHIFPSRLNDAGLRILTQIARQPDFWRLYKSHTGNSHPGSPDQLIEFWKSLKKIYDYFENHRKLPKVKIDRRGNYFIQTRDRETGQDRFP
jgi:murein L,D-transpeptidase YafK